MTKKVKITKEQANVIKSFKYNFERCMGHDLTYGDFYSALVDGYEVEPEFKEGDWVINRNGDIGKVTKVYVDPVRLVGSWEDTLMNVAPGLVRHATESEIQQEKERRFWDGHGRDVWELKMGDTLISRNDRFSCDVKFVEAHDESGTLLVNGVHDELFEDINVLKNKYKVFCFAENRLDVKANDK